MSHSTLQQALQQARQQLAALPGAAPRLEAEVLLSFSLGRPRSHLYAWPERPLEADRQAHFSTLVARRIGGEPIAYITGQREFWSLDLRVTPETLIPRPESELLVELALTLIPPDRPLNIADLGTGSGAIAAAIASERPGCTLFATDISDAALRIARENFDRLGLARVQTRHGHWCEALPRNPSLDLIVSNPPYIPDSDPHLTQGDLPWEPRSALASGHDGLDDLRCITGQAATYLPPGGWLLLEHGCHQGTAVRRLLTAAGFQAVATHRDLSGQERVSKGRR